VSVGPVQIIEVKTDYTGAPWPSLTRKVPGDDEGFMFAAQTSCQFQLHVSRLQHHQSLLRRSTPIAVCPLNKSVGIVLLAEQLTMQHLLDMLLPSIDIFSHYDSVVNPGVWGYGFRG
jgi:hypothetical protein